MTPAKSARDVIDSLIGGTSGVSEPFDPDVFIKILAENGYAIVPVAPTRKMLNAAYTAIKFIGDAPKGLLSRKNLIRRRYHAMVSAANARHPAPDPGG